MPEPAESQPAAVSNTPATDDLEATGERLIPEAFAGELVHAEHLARYLLAARLAPGRRVLDVASGEGYGSALLARAGATNVIGIDVDAATVVHARRRYSLDFREGDAAHLELSDASVDLITSFETIEHVGEPEAMLDEFCRVLAPDGLLLISTPNANEYLEDNRFHVREFEPHEFLELLGARFEAVRPLYQQNLLLSAILDEARLVEADPQQARPWEITKIAGVPAGRELYTLALCGRGLMPDLAGNLAVGADIHEAHELARLVREWTARANEAERVLREWTRRAETAERNQEAWMERAEVAERNNQPWISRAAEAERLVAEWNARAAEAERQVQELRATLERIRRSVSWRMTKPLRSLRRTARRSSAAEEDRPTQDH